MSTVMAYIGQHPVCGHIRFAAVDLPETARDTARDVAACIRSGLTVTRVTVKEARAGFGTCDTCKPKRKKASL